MSFLDFPTELILEVGKNMAPPDLYSLALANGRLERIFLDDLPKTVFEDRPRAAEFGAKLVWFHARKGDKQAIAELVEKGIIPIVGPTLLHKGIQCESSIAIRTLIECNFGLGKLNSHGFSPLAVAVGAGRPDVVAMLAARPEVDLNFRHPNRNWTALHLACLWKHPAVLRCLIQGRLPYLFANDPDWGIVAEIAKRPIYQQMCVKALLASYKLNVNVSIDGYTALHLAVAATQWRDTRILESLLQDTRTNRNPRDTFGRTPLNIAASFGIYDAVKLLLSSGADVNMESHPMGTEGMIWTPLRAAAHRGHEGVVRLLTCHPSIRLNMRGTSGETALGLALRGSHVAAANVLLSLEGIEMPNIHINSEGSYVFPALYSDAINKLLLRHCMAGNAQVEFEDECA